MKFPLTDDVVWSGPLQGQLLYFILIEQNATSVLRTETRTQSSLPLRWPVLFLSYKTITELDSNQTQVRKGTLQCSCNILTPPLSAQHFLQITLP